jgi:hypothetical protein
MKMNIGILVRCLGVGFLLLTHGCGKKPTKADLPGSYAADYGFAKVTVTLTADGKFMQTIKLASDGRVVSSAGTWTFNEKQRYIAFSEEFLLVVNGFGQMNQNFEHPTTHAETIFDIGGTANAPELGTDPTLPLKKTAGP